MVRQLCLAAVLGLTLSLLSTSEADAQQQAFGRSWGASAAQNWERFFHYPYVFYPQNYRSADYYRSADSLYFRYPQEMRIPVYNRKWHNYYPNCRPYHRGHQFILDVF